ncbi:MAG: hypothetical protein FJ026_12890 [Chloroflexi bacterium]|nr:hypothetical protein [Chloroflexota bacterium]
MSKVPRFVVWVGVFVVTMSLAIGLSWWAMRVRASVDIRRRGRALLPATAQATQVPCPMAQGGSLGAQVLCPMAGGDPDRTLAAGDCCDGPWGIEPLSSLPEGAPAYRSCH